MSMTRALPLTHSVDDEVPKERGWRHLIRNFGLVWFSVPLGTGILAVQITTIPFRGHWLYIIGSIGLVLNIVSWILVSLISCLRVIMWPELANAVFRDPKTCIFFGAIPIGLGTMVELICLCCVDQWGAGFLYLAWALWMVEVALSLVITTSICYILTVGHPKTTLADMSAAQLLPIAASIVSSGVGARVAFLLPNQTHAFGTLVTSYVMWGLGAPTAMCVLAMYYQRLAVHKLPPKAVIATCFVPLAPLGFGGFSIMLLGDSALQLVSKQYQSEPLAVFAANFLYVIGYFIGFIMWAFGILWTVFGVTAIIQNFPLPFNMTWWSFIFPMAVYAQSTCKIGEALDSRFFKVIGTMITLLATILWLVCVVQTGLGIRSGRVVTSSDLTHLMHKESTTR